MNFKLEDFVNHGMNIPKKMPEVKISNAKAIFESAFKYFLKMQNKEYTEKEGYSEICEWLTDNKGRGLLIMGKCSLGKTFAARYVIPAILLKYTQRVVKTYELNRDSIDDILKRKIAVIDDFGTEDIRNEYGTKRMALAEIVDNAEKQSNLLILTTNLSGNDIKERYGVRIYERLKAITRQVAIKGDSERK
jgi:DNA replication protein DnaC